MTWPRLLADIVALTAESRFMGQVAAARRETKAMQTGEDALNAWLGA